MVTRVDTADVLDPARLAELRSVIGKPRVDRLIRIFANDIGPRPARLRETVHSGDLRSARHEAHALKGAAFSIGAEDVGRAAAAVEVALPGTELELALERLETTVAAAVRRLAQRPHRQTA